ncbi:hypothetical protein [Dyella nitratireducens]|uniref:Uncharacterized protein n=1 Tax=Dyella nitratireducens TaxID=1849580 RepID=A0ABQ1FMX4_9GAMM|nr:hypothetical protein [Dyella nitratireducens]GGA22170.1 hypothetical protein GCM10010981_07950 [Dyella nitratireducens]GLQ44145.1 hypothetical protein GCM10007902_39950 [Dyella nitratireducens]
MSTLEVKALALQLSTAIDGMEKRIDHAARQSLQATRALDLQSKQSLETINNLVQQALEQFRQGARQAIEEGVRDAMGELDQAIQEGASRMDRAVSQLDQRTQHIGRFNVLHAWKTFVASALCSLAVITVAIYAGWQAHTDIKRSEWVQQINAAVEAGHLTICPEGGLCVQVNSKWVRLSGK